MYQMLASGHWIIGANCEELIGRIPGAIRDEKRVEDIAKFDAIEGQGGDDPLDSARYGLKTRFGRKPGTMPFEERLREAMKDIPDPTNRAVQTQRMIAQHAKAEQPTGRLRWMRNK